jgi:hypothetical protein
MADVVEKKIIPANDPLVRPGKGINSKETPVNHVGITDDDLDDDPEKAVKQMEEIESSMDAVENEVKAKTKKVEESANSINDDEVEDLSGNEEQIDDKEMDVPIVSELTENEPVVLDKKVEESNNKENTKNEESIENNVKEVNEQSKSQTNIKENKSETISMQEFNSPQKIDSNQNSEESNSQISKKLDGNTKNEMKNILDELRKKMEEIDILTRELKKQKTELSKTEPRDTEKLLEEIEVPSLEMLK